MKTCVVIPTFNEDENIARLIREILRLGIEGLIIVVVDDDSLDGTAESVRAISGSDPRVRLINRSGRRGRGEAGIVGFRYALGIGADYIIEMDADFSHDPRYIPGFLEAIKDCDIVLGSRFVPGGEDKERGFIRELVTKLAGIYVRGILGLKIRDVSSGFRCFTRESLERMNLDNIISTGPSIVLEMLYKAVLNGFRVKEMPIVFRDRRQGKTKLNYTILLDTMLMVLNLRKMKNRF